MYRQGDVLIAPTEKIPFNARLVLRKDHRRRFPGVERGIVLAAGEETGHHHSVDEPHVRLFEQDDRTFIRVASPGASVTHEEHGSIDLPPGDYEVRTQREYTPPSDAERSAPRARDWTPVLD